MAVASTEGASPASVVQQAQAHGEPEAEQGIAGLYRAALYFESKYKVLELVKLFAQHGYMSLEEVASAMERSSELAVPQEVASLRRRIQELEEEIRAQRLANEMIGWEREEAELTIRNERDLVRESLIRIAHLESQLRDARRTTLKLIAASRNSLSTLKRVRDHLASETYAVGVLTPLVQDFRELTQVVQEFHALALVKASTAPLAAQPH